MSSKECHYAKCNYAECHYAECCNAEYNFVECRYAECLYADCHNVESQYVDCRYAESNYAECCYEECRGAKILTILRLVKKSLLYFEKKCVVSMLQAKVGVVNDQWICRVNFLFTQKKLFKT